MIAPDASVAVKPIMKRLPSREETLALLDRLEQEPADALESDVLDFKRWQDARASMSEAIEAAVCFANADGGVIVFGVRDRAVGRRQAISGCTGYDVDTWQRAIYDTTRPNLTVEIEELLVPEGNLLLVRVPRGPAPPYGTAAGLYQIRVGRNCMPYSPEAFQRRQVALGAIDWSAQPAEGLGLDVLDGVEIARLRNTIESLRPQSPLLSLSDQELLQAVGAVRDGELTRAGLLLLGKRTVLARVLPQHEVIYLYEPTPVDDDFREDLKAPLLYIVQRTHELIQHPERNPVRTLRLGLFHIQIPAYPEESFREAILNALIHRDYLEPDPSTFTIGDGTWWSPARAVSSAALPPRTSCITSPKLATGCWPRCSRRLAWWSGRASDDGASLSPRWPMASGHRFTKPTSTLSP
jgi:ATP-dependent DNA helicase RecG